jgi:hypothetical protein
MLSIKTLCVFLTIQFQFIGMVFVYLWALFIVVPLETMVIYYGIYESHFLELCTDFNVQHFNEMLFFEMRNEYETPCVVYLEDKDLELSSWYGMCITFYNIVLSLNDIFTTGNVSRHGMNLVNVPHHGMNVPVKG